MRSADSYATGTLGPEGALAGELVPIDVTQPLPAPFTERALAVLELQDGARSFVVRDAAGRRLGARVPVGGTAAALAWTGSRFLVATTTTADVGITPIDCVP